VRRTYEALGRGRSGELPTFAPKLKLCLPQRVDVVLTGHSNGGRVITTCNHERHPALGKGLRFDDLVKVDTDSTKLKIWTATH
jgi:hypothetical protein